MLFHVKRSIRPQLSGNIEVLKERTNSVLKPSVCSTELSLKRERFIQAEHLAVHDKLVSWLLIAPSTSIVSSEYCIFAGLELPIIQMKQESLRSLVFVRRYLSKSAQVLSTRYTSTEVICAEFTSFRYCTMKFLDVCINKVSVSQEKCFPNKRWFECYTFPLPPFLLQGK